MLCIKIYSDSDRIESLLECIWNALLRKTPCSSVVCVQKICIKHFHFSLSWFPQGKKRKNGFFLDVRMQNIRFVFRALHSFKEMVYSEHFAVPYRTLSYVGSCMLHDNIVRNKIEYNSDNRLGKRIPSVYVCIFFFFLQNYFCFKFFLFLDTIFFMCIRIFKLDIKFLVGN